MRRGGFTLVEILVALGIAVMVMTAVLGSLDYTQRAVNAIHNVIETESQGPRILELLREDLSRLAVYDAAEYRVLKGEDGSIAGADADRLDFLCYRRSLRPFYDPVRMEFVRAPLVEVGYRLRQHPTLYDFLELYRREDFLQDDEPFRDGGFTLLYDRVTGLDLRYYARPETDPTWEDEWDSEEMEALPFAIEVRLELEVQPRRSKESLEILGANRARLLFEDILTIDEPVRWVFRNRIHPVLPGPPGGEAAGESGTGGPGTERPQGGVAGATTTTTGPASGGGGAPVRQR